MNARIPDHPAALQPASALARISQVWDEHILPPLTDYIRIPAKSPLFAPDWEQQGLLDTVVRNAAAWVEAQQLAGLTVEVVRLPGRTPVLFFEIAATQSASRQTVLMYGHLDKQPEFSGWRSDLGPWTPQLEDGKLYGRGGADDGYAVYASIAAVQELQRQGVPHPRIVGLIETSEESGSRDLLPYIDALKERLGDVALVVCLDSGAGNYDQLWLTTSLRGMARAVAAKGYADTTIADIVREASVSRRTFYENFADKAECLTALYEAASGNAIAVLRAAIDPHSDWEAQVEQAMAAYFGVLARNPEVWLLDEPFSALDAVTRTEMQDLLRTLISRHNASAVMVTHDIDEALILADRAILIGNKPGRQIGEWRLALPYPRHDALLEMNSERVEILQALRDAHGHKRQVETVEFVI